MSLREKIDYWAKCLSLTGEWENLKCTINFFTTVDNIHKFPYIRDLICKIGRHDMVTFSDGRKECFYCLLGKDE